MEAELINPEALRQINSWADARIKRVHGSHVTGVYSPGWAPLIGMWVPGVVACFLYQTDSYVAYIDGFVSDPDVDSETKLEAMVIVGNALTEKARDMGYRMVCGTTTYPIIAETAKRCGFSVTPFNHTYMSKLLLPVSEMN